MSGGKAERKPPAPAGTAPRHNSAIRSKKQRHRLSAAGRFCGKSPPRLVSTQKKPLPPREQNAAHLSFLSHPAPESRRAAAKPPFFPAEGKSRYLLLYQSSVYFALLLYAFSTGYFSSLRFIFASTISSRSSPQASAISMQ